MVSTSHDSGALPSDGSAASVPDSMEKLEAALGYAFHHKRLLAQALTHRSWSHEGTHAGAGDCDSAAAPDNERLEFLGDAVVGLAAAEWLYLHYPELAEGELTRLRAALVSRGNLSEVAKSVDLGDHLRLGRGEERSGGRAKPALLANGMEAVLGALYLDGGMEAVRPVVARHVMEGSAASLHDQLRAGTGTGDFKSALQELLQSRRQGQPEYRTTGESGPDHRKEFQVEVRCAGQVLAQGSGRNRKRAEQEAARRAMEILLKETA